MGLTANANPNSFLPAPTLQKVVIDPYRAILAPGDGDSVAKIVADAVIEESHSDRATITRHPVEQGSTISDNAVDEPCEVTLTYGWSAGSPQNTGLIKGDTSTEQDLVKYASQTGKFGVANPHFLQALYATLLLLKTQKTPFTIYTGKRVYQNMLIESISTTTDVHTENALIVRIVCVEVIIVTTTTFSLQQSPAGLSDPAGGGLQVSQQGTQQAKVTTLPDPALFTASLTTTAAGSF